MSLKIWLPFDKDLENIGLLNIPNFSLKGFTQEVGGKIGQHCYTDCGILHFSEDFLENQWSLTCWVKSTSWGVNNDIILCKNNNQSTNCQFYLSIINGKTFNLGINGGSGNGAGGYSYTFNSNTWYHVAATYDGLNYAMYINGDKVKFGTYDSEKPSGLINLGIGCRSTNANGTGQTGGNQKRLNDVRIYDHALSPLEIKQISQGLILHYKLNNNFNLIKNGYGESGSENWGTVANVSSDIPTGNSCIKQSFYNNTTQEYIPLISSHEYKFEVYIKNTSTSGSTYPSFYPYDIDKNFINVFNCPEGFNLSTMTTLTKELKSGDTKIEVADLSKWNANSGHYYNYAALFGYRDSTGFLYPNGTYTRNTPAFGSSTNAKTNLDKTNNIITLNSSYNGPTMAVGTSVCASTAGSTYYYPFGNITKSSINDWTYKTVNFIPQNVPRLRYAKYIKYSTYDGTLHAGIKLIDLFYDLNKIQDSSGYNHNGQLYSYDTQGGFISVSNTPRYDTSVYIDSANNTTNTASGTTYIYGHCSLTNPTQMTIAFWCKPIAGYGGGTTQGQFCTTNIAFGNNAGSDYQASAMNHRDGAVDINDSASSTQCRPTINFIANEWHHYVFTYNGKDAKSYRDGVLQDTKSFSESKSLDSFLGVIIGFSKAGGVWRSNKSYYSDFRVYCTALNQNDIKKLYNINMSIDNFNNIHTFELDEILGQNKITKTGIFKNYMVEPYLILKDGSKWKLMLYHYVDNGNNLFTSSNASYCNDIGLYSRLKDIDNYTYNGIYEFYVLQDNKQFRWTQTSAPTASSIAGKTVVQGYDDPVNGLAKGTTSYTYIGYDAWWGACGCWVSYSLSGKKGIPGFGPHNVNGLCLNYLALYVRVNNNNFKIENSINYVNQLIEK